MATVTLLEAQTNLEQLVDALVSGAEREVFIEYSEGCAIRMVAAAESRSASD